MRTHRRLLPFTRPLVLSACLLVTSLGAGRCDVGDLDYSKGLGNKEISIPLRQPSTDDYLLAMAKVADANIITDATRLPAAPPLTGEWHDAWSTARAGQWKGALGSLILSLAHERQLAHLRFDERTFLFWPEPDFVKIARRIAGGENIRLARLPDENSPVARIIKQILEGNPALDRVRAKMRAQGEPLDRWNARQLLTLQFMREMDVLWQAHNGPTPESKEWMPDPHNGKVMPLADLPAQLRLPILARLQAEYLSSDQVTGYKAMLGEDFWENARVRLSRPSPDFPQGGLWIESDSKEVEGDVIRQFVPFSENAPAAQATLRGAGDTRAQTANQPGEPAPAQAAPKAKQDAKTDVPAAGAPAADAPPAGTVSLEVKRMPLPALLAEAGRQSGLELTIAPDAPFAGATVTARVHQMPVAGLMSALGRLFGAVWEKEGENRQTLRLDDKTDLERQMFLMGDLTWFRFWRSPARRKGAPAHLTFEGATWSAALLGEVNEAALSQARGVPLAALSPDLQLKLRSELASDTRKDAALWVLRYYHSAMLSSLEGSRIRLSEPRPDKITIKLTRRRKRSDRGTRERSCRRSGAAPC